MAKVSQTIKNAEEVKDFSENLNEDVITQQVDSVDTTKEPEQQAEKKNFLVRMGEHAPEYRAVAVGIAKKVVKGAALIGVGYLLSKLVNGKSEDDTDDVIDGDFTEVDE